MTKLSVDPHLCTAQIWPDDRRLVTAQLYANEGTHGKA